MCIRDRTELITSGQLAVDIPPKRNLTPRSFSLMKKTFVKREALYRLGYWQEYVDTYHPNLNHETGGTAAGVAIIQDPEPYQLDDKGYYRDTFTLRHLYSPDEITEIKESTWMTVASAADKTKKELRSIYRYTAIIKAYSDLMDYDFRGHMDVILLSLIHISEPTRLLSISYAVFCLKKKKNERYKQSIDIRR